MIQSRNRWIPTLPNLTILGVHLHMSSPHGVTEFLDLLRYMPYLIELTVTVRNCSIQFHSACYKHQFNRFIACWQRLDSTHPTEALQSDQQTFAATPCIASSLYNVIMDSFRGGAVEVAFATNVLAVACRLGSLLLRPHPKLLLATATEASNSPLICPRASASCQVVFSKLPQI